CVSGRGEEPNTFAVLLAKGVVMSYRINFADRANAFIKAGAYNATLISASNVWQMRLVCLFWLSLIAHGIVGCFNTRDTLSLFDNRPVSFVLGTCQGTIIMAGRKPDDADTFTEVAVIASPPHCNDWTGGSTLTT